MKYRSVFYITAGLFLASLLMLPGSADARKWSFSTNGGKVTPRLKQHFISMSGKADSVQKVPTSTFRPGDRLYFYYKIGPLQCKKGSGAPFQTRLIIKKGRSTVKDFGWHNSNAANQSQMHSNTRLAYYHSARWNLTLSPSISSGRYTAVVNHKDINSGRVLNVRFRFRVDTSGDGS